MMGKQKANSWCSCQRWSVLLNTLFLRKQGAILFTVDISHANRGRFYYQNGQNSTFPNK